MIIWGRNRLGPKHCRKLVLGASATNCHLSPIANSLQVRASPELIGKPCDGFREPQFLNNAIVAEVMSGPLAQKVNHSFRCIHPPPPLRNARERHPAAKCRNTAPATQMPMASMAPLRRSGKTPMMTIRRPASSASLRTAIMIAMHSLRLGLESSMAGGACGGGGSG